MFYEKLTQKQAQHICEKLNLGTLTKFDKDKHVLHIKMHYVYTEPEFKDQDGNPIPSYLGPDNKIEVDFEDEYTLSDTEIEGRDNILDYEDVMEYRKMMYEFFGTPYLEYLTFEDILTWEKNK